MIITTIDSLLGSLLVIDGRQAVLQLELEKLGCSVLKLVSKTLEFGWTWIWVHIHNHALGWI